MLKVSHRHLIWVFCAASEFNSTVSVSEASIGGTTTAKNSSYTGGGKIIFRIYKMISKNILLLKKN